MQGRRHGEVYPEVRIEEDGDEESGNKVSDQRGIEAMRHVRERSRIPHASDPSTRRGIQAEGHPDEDDERP
jgi:hypothetical protein